MRNRYLPPIILQAAGLVLLAVFAAVWIATGQESPLLVGAALTLCGVGAFTSAVGRLPRGDEPPREDSAP